MRLQVKWASFMFVSAGIMTFHALPAVAQMSEFKLSRSSDKFMVISAPLLLVGGEVAAHVETNLWSEASLALEYISAPQSEEYDKEKIKKENTSLMRKAWEVGLLLSRYSRAEEMGGFYWSLGAGYRSTEVALKQEPTAGMSVSRNEELDEDGRLTYRMTGKGMTGRGRLGYRYVADSWPLVIGGFFGVRHFASKFDDKENADDARESTDEQKQQMTRAYMSRPELALEMGFVF